MNIKVKRSVQESSHELLVLTLQMSRIHLQISALPAARTAGTGAGRPHSQRPLGVVSGEEASADLLVPYLGRRSHKVLFLSDLLCSWFMNLAKKQGA